MTLDVTSNQNWISWEYCRRFSVMTWRIAWARFVWYNLDSRSKMHETWNNWAEFNICHSNKIYLFLVDRCRYFCSLHCELDPNQCDTQTTISWVGNDIFSIFLKIIVNSCNGNPFTEFSINYIFLGTRPLSISAAKSIRNIFLRIDRQLFDVKSWQVVLMIRANRMFVVRK